MSRWGSTGNRGFCSDLGLGLATKREKPTSGLLQVSLQARTDDNVAEVFASQVGQQPLSFQHIRMAVDVFGDHGRASGSKQSTEDQGGFNALQRCEGNDDDANTVDDKPSGLTVVLVAFADVSHQRGIPDAKEQHG